ncbi:aminoglycoside phosphotransferase family protein [Nonomuraea jiangxiensis]|uniref:Predicted kinase, aminoglycoside phosphotransferase (APT) family n=1 Tax=Nonomuraea jiangxiensis TaxID=633440 RepID=A0A1G9ES29_9ACTN|nr:aminoglycoside phosphotransferase family protein [Nonomuraea jiangxiensis]SDK78949.1 Predicted kinase, aminoglycoside phosphotransferase (APT) family [Nonomuraea jiangxiensis]
MVPHRMPVAEVDVSPELVRRLLTIQHPDLAHLPLEVMANGWDNVMCRIGDTLVARLPRREVATTLLVHEQRWLPVLGPRLPLPVPAPVRMGRPDAGYPWPWSVVPFLPGRTAAHNPPADPEEAAAGLGRFLAALHTPAPPDAPANPHRGIPLADRTATVTANLSVLGDLVDHRAVTRVWEPAVAAPAWPGPPVWLHGDLHPGNILVHHGRISGVIDFGDITSGDPATDLSVAWMLLPAGCHDAFQHAYGTAAGHPPDDHLWLRARAWALALSLAFLANSADHPLIADIGRRTLNAVLAEGRSRAGGR